MPTFRKVYYIIFLLVAFSTVSCKKFIKVDPPQTDIMRAAVFSNDASANSACADIYFGLHGLNGVGGGGTGSIAFLGAISSDVAINRSTVNPGYKEIYENNVQPPNTAILATWSGLYAAIYKANALLEGIAASTGISDNMKVQLKGEALFLRAFCYFYLVNFFGEVPLILNTDYHQNLIKPRSAVADVYAQMISDLKEAQTMLADDYAFTADNRIRANKAAVTALLARIYLYKKEWANAETQASLVIANTTNYELVSIATVFLKNSKETIFAFPTTGGNVGDLSLQRTATFIQPLLLDAFETDDQRKVSWVTGNLGNKYKSVNNEEHSMVIRLAELYLVRAEARARQDKFAGAQSDIDAIRTRAGLANTTANDKPSLLAAIEQERWVELFYEWGHRWFDLARTDRANAVLGALKLNWVPTDILYPIPEAQILRAPVTTQNPGY